MSIASGTICKYDLNNSFEDSSGNGYDNIVAIGSPPFITTPAPINQTYAIGETNSSNCLELPSDVLTAIAGLPVLTYEFFCRWSPVISSIPLLLCYNSDANTYGCELRCNSVHRLSWPGGLIDFQTPSLDGDAWWFCQLVYSNSTGAKMYWSKYTNGLDMGPSALTTTPVTNQTLNRARFGALLVDRTGAGIHKIRISNVDRGGKITLDPVDVTAVSMGSNQINLTWTDNLFGLRYTIYRNTTDNSSTAQVVGRVNQGIQVFNDTNNLIPGTQYFYFIKIEASFGNESEFSSVATANTTSSPFIPGSIVNFIPKP